MKPPIQWWVGGNPMGMMRTFLRILLFLSMTGLIPFGEEVCSFAQVSVSAKSNDSSMCNEKPIDDYQIALLDLAMDTASRIPGKPHIKDRSRAQESVVEACLKLDQPITAELYTQKIDDWRKGSCYAHLALYGVQHGCTQEVSHFLSLATETAKSMVDWRRDRIRVQIASVNALLGGKNISKELKSTVTSSESDKVQLSIEEIHNILFDEELQEIRNLLQSADYDHMKSGLMRSVVLYGEVYETLSQRDQVLDLIRSSWNPMPVSDRFSILVALGHYAIDHSDTTNSMAITIEGERLIKDYQWKPEQEIPMLSDISILFNGSGDCFKASEIANSALSHYESKRDGIVNIWRAQTLRPLAEAYQEIGDLTQALNLYHRVVNEGIDNSNSRPRAEDLTATCLSMAVHSVKPDAALWDLLRTINKELGPPW